MKKRPIPSIHSLTKLGRGIGVAGALMLAGPAQAATISWQTPVTISAGSDVSTNGTQVYGRNVSVSYPVATAVVNGADFGYSNPNWAVTYSSNETGTNTATSAPALGGPDAANYEAILETARFNNTSVTPMTLTFGNLTVGREYELQIWVADYRAFDTDRAETIAATGANTNVGTPILTFLDSGGPVHGQWVIGTWTADATSIGFDVTATQDIWAGYSALQLRDITAVPEPGAAALGAFGLLALLRRRRI